MTCHDLLREVGGAVAVPPPVTLGSPAGSLAARIDAAVFAQSAARVDAAGSE